MYRPLVLSLCLALGVPALAMPPPAPAPVVATTLPPPSGAAMGTLTTATGALGPDIWQGAAGPAVILLYQLMPDMPAPMVRDWARRLWLSPAVPPTGWQNEADFATWRVRRLVQAGMIAEAAALLALLPKPDPALRNTVRAYGLLVDPPRTCAHDPDDDDWRLACLLVRGEGRAAQLLLDVRRETGWRDPALTSLVDALAAGSREPVRWPEAWGGVTLWQALVLRLSNRPLTAEAAGRVRQLPLPQQLPLLPLLPALEGAELALTAARAGLIDGLTLASALGAPILANDAKARILETTAKTSSLSGRDWVTLYQAAVATDNPARRWRLLARLLAHLQPGDWHGGVGALLLPLVGETAPGPREATFAPAVARLLLAQGRAAHSWLAISADAAVADLKPVSWLANPPAAGVLQAWAARPRPPAEQQRAVMQLAILQAAGVTVPPDLLLFDGLAPQAVVAPLLQQEITRLTARPQRGSALALLLAVLPADGAVPAQLAAQLVALLRANGWGALAQDLARAALLQP